MAFSCQFTQAFDPALALTSLNTRPSGHSCAMTAQPGPCEALRCAFFSQARTGVARRCAQAFRPRDTTGFFETRERSPWCQTSGTDCFDSTSACVGSTNMVPTDTCQCGLCSNHSELHRMARLPPISKSEQRLERIQHRRGTMTVVHWTTTGGKRMASC